MKARIKYTDQIIEVNREPFGWIWESKDGRMLMDREELIFLETDESDWQDFRREAAKDILVGLCANNNVGYYGNSNTALASSAIELTDELIRQLKDE
jgi:hypothetical protein